MIWLEENFSRFFRATNVPLDANSDEILSRDQVVDDFIATSFSEDGQTIDFAIKAFDPEQMSLKIEVQMKQE